VIAVRTLLRAAATGVATAALVLAPAVAGAGVPDYQRVIKARTAAPTAPLVTVDGCIRTEIWVSSSDNVFGGRPGRVVKQGLTSVGVTQFDTCAGTRAPRSAAGGDPGEVVFDGIGQTRDRLRSTPRFDRAWIGATVAVVDDVSGTVVPVRLDLTWTLTGEFDRDTSHTHVRFPHEGVVNAHTQTLTGDALTSGDIWLGDEHLTFEASTGAILEQVKYGCQVIRHPRSPGADLSC